MFENRSRRFLSLSLILLLLCALSIGFVSCAQRKPIYEPSIASLDSLRTHVQTLASPRFKGRGLDNGGHALARDYLIEQFEKIGLQPLIGDSYLQTFEASLGVRAIEQSLQIQTSDGNSIDLTPAVDFSPLGFSGDGYVTGNVFFAGYGITDSAREYDSYKSMSVADQPLAGCIVVLFRYEPLNADGQSKWSSKTQWSEAAHFTKKIQRAVELGAVGVLFVNPSKLTEAGLLSLKNTSRPEGAPIPVMHISESTFGKLLNAASRDSDVAIKTYQQRADAGKDRPDHLEGVTVTMQVALESHKENISNVVGLLPGRGKFRDQYVVVGAHYDHLGDGEFGSLTAKGHHDAHAPHLGADDNASGVAAVVGVCESISELSKDANNLRGVIFVLFTAEERGLLGSAYFASRLKTDLGMTAKQIVAMVNFDMVGRLNKQDEFFALGAETGNGFEQLIKRANAGVGLSIQTESPVIGGSDHMVFHNLKIPAVHLFTGGHSDYHRPSDTADKINYAGLARVSRLATRLVDILRTQSTNLKFAPPIRTR